MQNNGTAVSIVQTATAPEKPPRLCIQCWEPIEPLQPYLGWPSENLLAALRTGIQVAYHETCIPASIRNWMAVSG
jgi:hypothetical protein